MMNFSAAGGRGDPRFHARERPSGDFGGIDMDQPGIARNEPTRKQISQSQPGDEV
jgi:hypothetical protein